MSWVSGVFFGMGIATLIVFIVMEASSIAFILPVALIVVGLAMMIGRK